MFIIPNAVRTGYLPASTPGKRAPKTGFVNFDRIRKAKIHSIHLDLLSGNAHRHRPYQIHEDI
jgi:hypothetical protein